MAGAQPIFIGGTGRSGTSVMASLLNSHPDVVLPAHENKLIVERGGLRDLVNQLGGPFDMKRHHYAVMDFIRWAKKLRTFGFTDPRLNDQVAVRMKTGVDFQKAAEAVARENPQAPFSLHAVGQGFGLAHYDATLNAFVQRICATVTDEGLVDTEGLVRPFITPRPMDRASALGEARALLDALYAPSLQAAGASRWCDDTPSNWLYLDFLCELYPNMKFIHMVRDPRDVVGSYIRQVWAPSDPAVVVAILKAQFAGYVKRLDSLPPDRVLEVRLEDLTSDRERVLDGISGFLGLDNRFDADLFSGARTNTGSYAEGLGPETVELIESELSDWMVRQQYRP
jgi:hypothetical protein